jgi:hypothetical protein
MSFYSLVRKLHFYVGLQAMLGLCLFSAATIIASLHTHEKTEPEITRHTYRGSTTLDPGELALRLHDQIGQKYESVPHGWMISSDPGNEVRIVYFSPNGKRDVALDLPGKTIEIRTYRNTFLQYLNRMHTESLGRRRPGDHIWLWLWSLYIELSLIALILLPVTGTYIWLTEKRKQPWAMPSMVLSITTIAFVYFAIR